MSDNVSNWVSGDANKMQVENAQMMLSNLKRKRYTKDKKYKLIKVGDHPLTYNEVLMSKEEIEELQEIDECKVLDEGMSESTEIALPKEEVISAQLTVKNFSLGDLGFGTLKINIHD